MYSTGWPRRKSPPPQHLVRLPATAVGSTSCTICMGEGRLASCHLAVCDSSLSRLCGRTDCSGGPCFRAGGCQVLAGTLTRRLRSATPLCLPARTTRRRRALPPRMAEHEERKHAPVFTRLAAHDYQRRAREAERRALAEAERDPLEDADSAYSAICARADSVLSSLRHLPTPTPSPDLDRLASEASQLELDAARAADFLPAQLARSCADHARSAAATVKAARPKRSFSFSSKSKAQRSSRPCASPSHFAHAQPGSDLRNPGVSDRCDVSLQLVYNSADGHAQPPAVALERLNRCTVHVTGVVPSLAASELSECTIVALGVAGPLHVDNCHLCTFACASHQLRVTDTTSTTFFTRCTSAPTLDRCSALSIAPLVLSHQDQCTSLLRKGQLSNDEGDEECKRNIEHVQDFGWVKSGPSPNWTSLSYEDAESLQPNIVPDNTCFNVTV